MLRVKVHLIIQEPVLFLQLLVTIFSVLLEISFDISSELNLPNQDITNYVRRTENQAEAVPNGYLTPG